MAKKEKNNELEMRFDLKTIEHLGLKMYSNLATALAELVANAYDADAKKVTIKLNTTSSKQSIEVVDDGDGMNFEEINDKFLIIGRNRRKEGFLKSPSGKRIATGKKGLGKLAFFGIGQTIIIETAKKNSGKKTTFTLDWNEILNTSDSSYKPKHKETVCSKSTKGTIVKLNNLNKSLDIKKEDLAIELSKLFNFIKPDFKVYIVLNKEKPLLISNKLKYQNLDKEFQWIFPGATKKIKIKYPLKNKITGNIISTKKPLKPGLRGISLFANGRLVNAAEFFGASESSHAYSYITGWLDVDFVDSWKEDVISTDRQTLNWNFSNTNELREFLKKTITFIEKDWHDKRNKAKENIIKSRTSIDISKWYDTLPKEILTSVRPIVTTITEKLKLPEDDKTTASIVQQLHNLVPEYPYYHWRHVHPKVQAASKSYYQNENFYTAFLESVKKYISEVKKKSGSANSSERSMMGEVFSNRKLSTTKKYKKTDGTPFNSDTIKNIEEGQHYLSEGMVIGCRHPVSHEEIVELKETGLFSEKDCLDALSLLSHLFKRLDDAEKI